MVLTPLPMDTEVKFVHPKKADVPKDVILLGIEIVVKPVQLWKAFAPIDVTVSPKITLVKVFAVFLLLEIIVVFELVLVVSSL